MARDRTTARPPWCRGELAHITLGHEDRRGEGLHRGIGEVEAESVAMMVTAAWGMDSTGYTVPYVGGWSSSVNDRDPTEVVRETGELVRRTAVAILDRCPTRRWAMARHQGLNKPTAQDALRSVRTPPRPHGSSTRAARGKPVRL